MALRIAVRADATPTMGVGHVIRCLALADELTSRGLHVLLLGIVDGVPWVRDQVRRRGLEVVPAVDDPHGLAEQAVRLGLAAVILDGYHLPPDTGVRLRERGITVLALVDGDFGAGQEADVLLDQNLGAVAKPVREGAVFLAGLGFALFRDDVSRRRPSAAGPAPAPRPPEPLRVLAVFGGTDAYGAAPIIVALILQTGLPVHVLAVAPRPQAAEALAALTTNPRQVVEVLGPVPDLAGLAVTCDVAVSASGSSVWELLCLGVPSAVVAVADNQEVGYRQVLEHGVAAPLGHLGRLRTDQTARDDAVAVLARLLGDPAYRAELKARGMALVDGQGRRRVADALMAAVEQMTHVCALSGTDSRSGGSLQHRPGTEVHQG